MGYGDELPEGNLIITKKIVIAIVLGIAAIVVGISAWYLIPESTKEQVSNLYELGQWAVDNGNLRKAENYYSAIIQIAPNEEKAWHEKGKILNRLQMCQEAIQHYEKYVRNFPDSSRAKEGLAIARNCQT